MGMDQYLLIPFLGGLTSIYQLFWCELQGYMVLTHCQLICYQWSLIPTEILGAGARLPRWAQAPYSTCWHLWSAAVGGGLNGPNRFKGVMGCNPKISQGFKPVFFFISVHLKNGYISIFESILPSLMLFLPEIFDPHVKIPTFLPWPAAWNRIFLGWNHEIIVLGDDDPDPAMNPMIHR